jgi:hypothetical protein
MTPTKSLKLNLFKWPTKICLKRDFFGKPHQMMHDTHKLCRETAKTNGKDQFGYKHHRWNSRF